MTQRTNEFEDTGHIFNTSVFGTLPVITVFFPLLFCFTKMFTVLHVKKLIRIGLYLDMFSAINFESLWSKHHVYYMTTCSTDLNNTVDKCRIL